MPVAPLLPASLADSSGKDGMHRAFAIDVLACPRCGGRLRLIATVEDPREIREVLAGLALWTEPVDHAPPSRESFAANPTADVNV